MEDFDPVVLFKSESILVLLLDDGDLAIFFHTRKLQRRQAERGFVREAEPRLLFSEILKTWKQEREQ